VVDTPVCDFGLDFIRLVRFHRGHLDGFFGQSPLFQRKETMNSFQNDAVLGWKGSFFNFPPEVLVLCNQTLIFENLFF
jgi:hypothetical protein